MSPPLARTIEVLGCRIHAVRQGRGTPIVCLHAIGHGGRDFLQLSERLGHRFEFIAIDWPGHGQSGQDSARASAARYAELLARVADELELRQFLVLANSIGGAAAIAYAAAYPHRVQGMILCNSAGLQRVGLLARLVCRHMAAFFGRGARGAHDFRRKFRRYYERDVLSQPAAGWRREEIIALADSIAPILREAWQGFADPVADIRHLAAKLECPVLFAWARHDRYVAWSRSRRAAQSVPRHAVKLFNASHAAFLEQPAAFDETLIDFVNGLALAPSGTGAPGAAAQAD